MVEYGDTRLRDSDWAKIRVNPQAVKQHFARRQRIAVAHDVECSCHSCRAFDGTDWSEAYARSTGAVK